MKIISAKFEYCQAAAELLLTGRVISGAEAERLGLVSRVSECAVTSALELCQVSILSYDWLISSNTVFLLVWLIGCNAIF